MNETIGNQDPAEHIVWDWNGTVFGDSRALIESTIDAAVSSPASTGGEPGRCAIEQIETSGEQGAVTRLDDMTRQRRVARPGGV